MLTSEIQNTMTKERQRKTRDSENNDKQDERNKKRRKKYMEQVRETIPKGPKDYFWVYKHIWLIHIKNTQVYQVQYSYIDQSRVLFPQKAEKMQATQTEDHLALNTS